MKPEVREALAPASASPVRAALELRGVSKRFGSVVAVDDVSFDVPEGSMFGLIGPNGAGKTTIFSMLAGYIAPSHGGVFVLGSRAGAVDVLRGKLGVLPQDALLPADQRVGEVLVFLAELQGMAGAAALEAARAALAEIEGTAWWGTRCGALSHGMAKRVGLAQAFLGDPAVVLLDEPTAGLDPRVAQGVRQLLTSRKGRCTLVISSHNLQELEEICDHAAILDRGRLITIGTMGELTASSSEIQIELADGPTPTEALRAVAGVTNVSFEPRARVLTISFDHAVTDAEETIQRACTVLFEHRARISALHKGRRLERRVIELTR